MSVQINEIVPQETIDGVSRLNGEIQKLLATYQNTATELAKGLQLQVKGISDLDKLNDLINESNKSIIETTSQLNSVMEQKRQVIANTTPTISRALMEQERINKAQREAFTEGDKVKSILEKVNGSYENRVRRLVTLEKELKVATDREKSLKKELNDGVISQRKYDEIMTELVIHTRSLKQEKADLTNHLKNEEREMQSVEGSYRNLSQRLELLKKAYKDLTADELGSEVGKELGAIIQNLDAHLKDLAADMGEFQRNVGNYAIAGQQGVVTTESVIEAIEREAKTTQDLIDQTKILGEAKLMLDKNDVNYRVTVEKLNAKLEENKRKLTDVTDILNKEAKSVAEAEAQNKRLHEAIRHIDLSSAGAQQRIKELNDKIERNTRIIERNTKAQKLQNATQGDALTNLLRLVGVNNKIGQSIRELGSVAEGANIDGISASFAGLGKALKTLVANPEAFAVILGLVTAIGLYAGGMVALGAAAKWIFDYNTGLQAASKQTSILTGLTGKLADRFTVDLQALADNMGKGFSETINAANMLVNQFGLSWKDAISLMSDGIAAGADANGKFIENIMQYAPAFKDAGIAADQFIAILSNTKNGLFTEKALESITIAGGRLRAMTKNTKAALEGVGISASKMQKDLASGNITMIEAVQQVTDKLKELPPNAQATGKVLKEVFGRQSAKGGEELLKSISDINDNLAVAKENATELEKVNARQLEAQKKLNEELATIFKFSGTSFEILISQAKEFITKGLIVIVGRLKEGVNLFIRLYNKSELLRRGVLNVVFSFKQLWTIVKSGFKVVFEMQDALTAGFEALTDFDFDKLREAVKKGMDAAKKEINIGVNEWTKQFEEFNDAVENSRLNQISLPELDDSGQNTTSAFEDYDETDPVEDATKQLKLLQKLEESKLAILEDGHEKEIALIRAKFKAKIDEIKGDSEIEKQLRIALAEECEHEIAKCEDKYQKELMKLNLDNRLAIVEKGSRSELDLRLAKLEQNRIAEIEAAKKTGADVNFINEKYEKEKLKLKEEFAEKFASKLEEQTANETNILNNSFLEQSIALKSKYADDLKKAGTNQKKREKLEKDFNKEMRALQHQFVVDTINAEITLLEKIVAVTELSAEKRFEIEQELARKRLELADEIAEKMVEDAETTPDKAKWGQWLEDSIDAIEFWMDTASKAIGEITGLANALYDGQIQKIEELQEANQEASRKEIERIADLVEKQVISQEEGEARKRASEAATAKKEEELAKKKAALQRKQAVWDKANSIAQAGIATALAIMNALQTQPFMPLGLAMAAIAGAMGAVQIATIIATPIPQYAEGTEFHPGGLALVGDGGKHEVVMYGGKTWITPDKPMMVDLPKGASVLPDASLFEMERTVKDNHIANVPKVVINNDYNELKSEIRNLGALIKQQTKQQHYDHYISNFERYKNSKI